MKKPRKAFKTVAKRFWQIQDVYRRSYFINWL